MRCATARASAVVAVAGSLLPLAGCAVPIRTAAHAQPGHDLAGYVSFVWDEPEERPTGDPRLDGNPLFQQRVHAAIEWELTTRGIAPTPSDHDPELGRTGRTLAVHHHTSLQDHVAVYRSDFDDGLDEADQVVEYPEATFVVGLVDAQTRELVWSAWATLDFDKALTSAATMRSQVDAAVAAMFERFPVPVAGASPPAR